MRLKRECPPDTVNAGAAQAARFRQRSGGPSRGVTGSRFQRQEQYAIHIGLAQFARRTRPGFVQQTVEALLDKALAPFAHGLYGDVEFRRRLGVGVARGAKQDHASAQGQGLRALWLPGPRSQRLKFPLRQEQSGCWTSDFHSYPPRRAWPLMPLGATSLRQAADLRYPRCSSSEGASEPAPFAAPADLT